MRGVAYAVAGLPRRDLVPPRNDRESVAPLLAGFETDTEAKDAEAVAGRAAAAPRGAQVRPGAVPGATAIDPVRARCRTRGIRDRSCRVIRLVPVRCPFPHVSVHVEEAPWVGRVLPDVAGLADSAA